MRTVRIGFIGIGKMGEPIARRLVDAGHSLMVLDSRPGAAEIFAQNTGAFAPPSLAAMAKESELIITMLRTSASVQEVLIESGLASELAAGSTVIDMTSGSPLATRSIATALAKGDISMIDAPVSGGVKGARDGTLTLMVGGTAENVAKWRPIFEVFGSQIFHVGAVGSGQAVKALNNLVCASGLTAAAEAVIIGKRFGLDPAQMIDIFNSSSGRNHSTETKFKPFILSGLFSGGFALELMLKDISIALELAEDTATPAELGHSCLDMWIRARDTLSSNADSTEIARWLEAQKHSVRTE